MADPYALLAATDNRVASAFEAVNRNAIAAFNAESEAAKFGFQANMQVAELQEQRTHNQFMRDKATQDQTLRARALEQEMSIAKMKAARDLVQQDREWDVKMAQEARLNLAADLGSLDDEAEPLRRASWMGDLEADQKLKEIETKKSSIRKEYEQFRSKIRDRMNMGDSRGVVEDLGRLDAAYSGDEYLPPIPEDGMLASLEPYEDVPVGPNGVLPDRPDAEQVAASGWTTEPVANSVINSATQPQQEKQRDLFPAVMNEAAKKGRSALKSFMDGIGLTPREQSLKPAQIGMSAERSPSSVPEGGITSLSPEQTRKYKQIIGTNAETMPAAERPYITLGKRNAYLALLSAGDPEVVSQYNQLHAIGTNPNLTDAQANSQMEDAVKEGMISDATRRQWLLEKASNNANKGKTQDPDGDQMKSLNDLLTMATKAQALASEGTEENPKIPVLSRDEADAIGTLAKDTLSKLAATSRQKELIARIEQEKLAPSSPGAIQALQQEYAETVFNERRYQSNQRLPELNNQLRSRGVMGEAESFVELSKQGEKQFVDLVSQRLRNNGIDESTARAQAASIFKQYELVGKYASPEVSESGVPLSAPKSLEINFGPSSAAQNTIVDNTLLGRVAGFFGSDTNPATDRIGAAKFVQQNTLPGSDVGEDLADLYESIKGLEGEDVALNRYESDFITMMNNGDRDLLDAADATIRSRALTGQSRLGDASGLALIKLSRTANKMADVETDRVFGGKTSKTKVFPTKHPMVSNPDGSVSNVILSGEDVLKPDGSLDYVVAFPTMVNGERLTKEQAFDLAKKNGLENYPHFKSAAEMNRWAENNHDKIDENGYLSTKGSGRGPNQAEVDSVKNNMDLYDISGKFDLNKREDYHNALKRIFGVKILRSLDD